MIAGLLKSVNCNRVANMLKKNFIIRQISTVFILAVFAFSITPKIILHDAVAHHKDTPFKSNAEKNPQIYTAGFNCIIDNLVVESPFVEDIQPLQVVVATYFPEQPASHSGNFNKGHDCYLQLRGPPVHNAA
jgi:hypothetical protein